MERWLEITESELDLIAHTYDTEEGTKEVSVRDRYQYTVINGRVFVRLMPANDNISKLVSRENEPDEIKLSEYCAIFGKTISDTITPEEKESIVSNLQEGF